MLEGKPVSFGIKVMYWLIWGIMLLVVAVWSMVALVPWAWVGPLWMGRRIVTRWQRNANRPVSE